MESTKKTKIKYCIVPMCTNTSVSSPGKLFINVPKDEKNREKWCKAMKRNKKLSNLTTHTCCEDHFDLENDMENFMKYKMGAVSRIRLKKRILPHIFECQKTKLIPDERNVHKLNQQSTINELLVTKSSEAQSEIETIDENDIPTSQETGFVIDKIDKVDMKLNYHSDATNTEKSSSINVDNSPIKSFLPNKLKAVMLMQQISSPDSCNPTKSIDRSSDITYAESTSSSDSSIKYDISKDEFNEYMLKGTLMAIEREPKLFLGLPLKAYFVISLLSEKVHASHIDILITLKKLRLNHAFSVLAIDFGTSVSNVSRIFNKTLRILALYLQELITWPSNKKIEYMLPIVFRARYSNVRTIIDCLEIEIEKPSDPVQQAMTWSEYYKAYSLKYLISCTPDGLINFASSGYGGSVSDNAIVKDCDYLNRLSPGTSIMADKGFKNISLELLQRKCKLVLLPSVDESKNDVKESKRIASLRIHVERVISRLREFKILLPNTCIDNHLIQQTDFMVTIVCGLVNLNDYVIQA